MTNTIGVHVIAASANTAPSLPPISSRVINPGVTLLITNSATDADTPAQTLTYSLITPVTNAAINATSGVFNWRPLVTQADSTNAFGVIVTDNGSPGMSATQSFNVVVNPLTTPSIGAPVTTGGQVGFTVNGQVGPDYAVQGSTNMMDWSTLFIANPSTMPFSWRHQHRGTLPSQVSTASRWGRRCLDSKMVWRKRFC